MQGCKCVKCGAEIRYVPTKEGHIIVEVGYTEIVTDKGRVVQGHLRHNCPADKTKEIENGNNDNRSIE